MSVQATNPGASMSASCKRPFSPRIAFCLRVVVLCLRVVLREAERSPSGRQRREYRTFAGGIVALHTAVAA